MLGHLLLLQSNGGDYVMFYLFYSWFKLRKTNYVKTLATCWWFINFRKCEYVNIYVPHLQARITTRLQQYRAKAELSRNTRPQAWVPREKLPRPLTSSASAIRKLMRKAELMGISTDIFPVDTSDANASMDGRRKHKQPALTADFVNYYLGEETHYQLAEACFFSLRLQNYILKH